MIMIEIFKTDVQNKTQAKGVMNLLQSEFLEAKINFDLNDCDKILRVDGINHIHIAQIVNDLIGLGFKCEILN
jgi:hypothetical protein